MAISGTHQQRPRSVLRAGGGVPATTIHRILYTPVYDPEFEKVAEWLAGTGRAARDRGADRRRAQDRAKVVYEAHKSVPAALASAGLRGSDFITGWKRRESPLDIGLVDESSMLDERQFDDPDRDLPPPLVLFGRSRPARAGGTVGEMGVRQVQTRTAGLS